MAADPRTTLILEHIQAEYRAKQLGYLEMDIDQGIEHLKRIGRKKLFFHPKDGYFFCIVGRDLPAFYDVHRYVYVTDPVNSPDRVWRCDGARVRDVHVPDLLESAYEIMETGTKPALDGPAPVYMWLVLKRGLEPIAHLLDRSAEFL